MVCCIYGSGFFYGERKRKEKKKGYREMRGNSPAVLRCSSTPTESGPWAIRVRKTAKGWEQEGAMVPGDDDVKLGPPFLGELNGS
jgi:hypothetical protein